MAARRGLNNQERLALDIAAVTATGAVVAAPCYVYSLSASLSDTLASGLLTIGDTTAAADLVKESTKLRMLIPASGTAPALVNVSFNPPLYIANQLFFANSTGVGSVCVSYLAK